MADADHEIFKQNQILVAQNLRASHKIITKLEQSKASTEIMVDRLPDSYFIIDQIGRILKGNLISAKLLTTDMDGMINRNISRLFTRETWNIFKTKMDKLVDKNRDKNKEDTLDETFELVIDGEGLDKRSYHWNLRLFEAISNRRGYLICAFGRDITQIRQYEKQLGQIFSVIPLGISTTDQNGCIRGPYSAYMEYLLDIQFLEGKNFFDLVFGQSEKYMSKTEQLGVLELREIFGQEQLWFELSRKRFPTEIYYPLENGDGRWLGITYHPIVNDNIVVKMLIVLDERTEIVKARKEKESLRQKENIMIQRIMDIQRCDEATLVSSYEDLDSMLIRMETALRDNDTRTFCNILHGVKGVVRTAGFTYFKEITHDVEDVLLRKIDDHEEIDQQLLKNTFDIVRSEWQELIKLRKMQTSGAEDVSSYQSFMQKSLQIQKVFAKLAKEVDEYKGKSKEYWLELKEEISNLTKLPLSYLEAKIVARAKKTAVHLGKKVEIKFDWPDIYIDEKVIAQLNEVFLHLVNNAIDHGIELVADRKMKKKPEAGSIKIKGRQKGNHIEFEVEDDGAGVDLDIVKSRAIEKRIINEKKAANLKEDEIMQLLFRQGFSTADKVTDISGRGIGLDSVVQSVSRLGGDKIKVEQLEPSGMKFSFLILY